MALDTSKIIHAPVGGRYTVTAPIVKEDYGLYLKIEGLELPSTYEVDFSNSEHNGTSVTMIGNADGVLIPSQFIKSGKDVFAFLYHVGEDFGRTVYKFRIPNKVRPDRTDETPTPEEQSVIDQAISALNDAVAQTTQDKADADASAQSASADADRAEQARDYAETAQGKAEDAQETAERAKDDAETSERNASESERKAKGYAETASEKADAITGLTAQATTLPDGSSATASYNAETGVMSFGIPRGKDGIDGTPGAKGEPGTDGVSPTVSVTDITGGHRVAITDKLGSKTFDVMDGDDYVLTEQDKQDIADIAEADLTPTILNAFPTDTASGSIASFSDGADNLPLKSLVVDINPVQDLSNGDPSPENICPISGWTGMKIQHTGKNLCPIYTMRTSNFGIDYTVTTEGIRVHGTATSSSYSWETINTYEATWLKVPAGTYTFSVTDMYGTGQIEGYVVFMGFDIDGTEISTFTLTGANRSITRTYTKPVGLYYGMFVKQGLTVDTVVKIQAELGSTATSYEPYHGTTYPVTWQTEAGTVYGGTLDVTTGKLTVDMAMVDLGTLTPYKTPANVFVWHVLTPTNGAILCSNYATAQSGLAPSNMPDKTVCATNAIGTYYPVALKDSSYYNATVEEMKTAMSGVQLCYELATPIEIQLSANQINSLLGVNNIWADSGDTTAEYRADTKLFIERLTAPDSADMIADSNIVSGQYFMVGNSLYKATANIASGAQVIEGTNCIRKSLSEALNEINS